MSCSRLSRETDEDLAGTASTVRRWLLLEQPGPWGADALRQSRLPGQVADGLADLGKRLRMRVLLIRRHGRAEEEPAGPRTAFAALSTRRDRRLERLRFSDPAELLDLPWDRLADGLPVGGEPVAEPLLLVCTNGRHDACCAELGRPVAAALTAIEPDITWECSHFGGDRFAGNVVWLPDGVYYGRVSAEDATRIAASARDRRLSLPHLRGRSTLPFPVQAAEIALRRETGREALDALAATERRRLDGDTLRVTFRDVDGDEHVVDVRTLRDGPPRELSCGASPLVAPRYEARVLDRDEAERDGGPQAG